jgi:hypothetical protein
LMPWRTAERAPGDVVVDAGYPAGPACRGEGCPPLLPRDRAIAAHRYDGAAEDQRLGAVLAALVSGLVLRRLCYTVTGSWSAVTAAA